MSVQRAVWLYCDECDEPSSGDMGGAGETFADARDAARRSGWHRTSNGRDICPNCWEAGIR